MSANPRWSANELIPLADRLRYMLVTRIVLIIAVAAALLAGPGLVGPRPGQSPIALGLWVASTAGTELVWRYWRRRSLPLFGLSLLVDGFILVWLSTATGVTNLRYLVFLHIVAVVLLASYRTGAKVALWYTLLLVTVYFAQQNHAFGLHPAVLGTVSRWDLGQLGVFLAVLWFITLATAVFSSVNERELRRRRFDLEVLAHFAVALEATSDRQTVAALLLQELTDNFSLGRLVLLTAGRRPVVLSHASSPTPISDPPALRPSSALLTAQTSHETLLISVFDSECDPWLVETFPMARNFLVVPLHAEGGCVGVLLAEYDAGRSSRVERRLVSIVERFASHAAFAMRNAVLLEEMQRMANTDGLTSVANRRTFDAALSREVSRAIRSVQPMSLVMVDIDDFKALNDTYGHQIGDDVLRQVAAVLRDGNREIDVTARYGGEEFGIILPGSGPADAALVAERLRGAVEEQVTLVPVTVSIGVASWPDHGQTVAELVAAADEALYRAKRSGRNRVCSALSHDYAVLPSEFGSAPG